jgi:glycosyltransferase involved in cell wall biosynthesis
MSPFKKKILVYGNFYYKGKAYGGEITKTRNIYFMLSDVFGKESVDKFDIEDWMIKPFKLLHELKKEIQNYSNIVILPGQKNLLFILPFLAKRQKKYGFRIFYPIVGGFLPKSLKRYPWLRKYAKCVTGMYAETKALVSELQSFGLKNVFYSPVFTLRQPLSKEEQDISCSKGWAEPIRFCTFSRVTEKKGITIAIESVAKVNQTLSKERGIYLDIYGAIDKKYEKKFAKLLKQYGDFVTYKGFLSDHDLLQNLSNYYALLFPTYYSGEGFPATTLEAYMAGLPIIASDWRFNSEIVDDHKTGLLVHIDKKGSGDFASAIKEAISKRDEFVGYRQNCLTKVTQFSPLIAISPLITDLKA